MDYKYVIIGNSAAAAGCIEGIRSVDKSGSILVVSDEPHHIYGRPLISYLLWNKTTEEKMKYRPDSFYADNGVDLKLGIRAEKLDAAAKTVELSDGSVINYDKLLNATGSRPFVPPMEGLDSVESVFNFMTLDDAKGLAAALGDKRDKDVLIIGAGLIGLKCAEGISERAKSITVVDMADRILPSILDKRGSEIVQKHIEGYGVKFYLSDSAAKFEKNSATLKSGAKLAFDVLVVAVGVRPNTELVAQAGGKVNRGIETDNRCATSLSDVYAAGDCAESFDITVKQNRVLALLPNAYLQGETAGINMAGGDAVFDNAVPMNAMGVFGLHFITAGSYDGEELVTEDGGNYKKLVTRDGLLKGYIIIGDIAKSGIYTRLIRDEIPLDEIDFELVAKEPQFMAFSRAERAEKLGGVVR